MRETLAVENREYRTPNKKEQGNAKKKNQAKGIGYWIRLCLQGKRRVCTRRNKENWNNNRSEELRISNNRSEELRIRNNRSEWI